MSRYAIVGPDGVVVNVIEWDGSAAWVPPADHEAVSSADAQIGDTYAGGVFSRPNGEAQPVTPGLVDMERERRIALGADVTVGGATFKVQTRNEQDFRNINGLVSKGIVFVMQGDTTSTVSFRDAGNVERLLTGPQLIAMGEAVAAHVQAVYAASWAVKALSPIPANFRADVYWPS